MNSIVESTSLEDELLHNMQCLDTSRIYLANETVDTVKKDDEREFEFVPNLNLDEGCSDYGFMFSDQIDQADKNSVSNEVVDRDAEMIEQSVMLNKGVTQDELCQEFSIELALVNGVLNSLAENGVVYQMENKWFSLYSIERYLNK